MTDDKLFGIESESRDRGQLNGKYKHSWVEESLGVDSPLSDETQIGLSGSYLGSSIDSKKNKWALRIVFVGLAVVMLRLCYLQLWRGSEYRS